MQRDAKATHRRMLHQFAALWAKGMTGEVVQALILSLNDRCTPNGALKFHPDMDGRERSDEWKAALERALVLPMGWDS